MVERRKLTVDLINELEPPLKGERWIADTEVLGFGLRLWGGKTSGKSFAIRVSNKNGKTIRSSISSVGDKQWLDLQLNIARDIARDKIRQLKGIEEPLTFRERMQIEWRPKLREYTFDQLTELAINVQRKSTKSEQYVDDNWSRYTAYASSIIGSKKAIDVTAEEIIVILDSLNNKPAQKRNLHSFLNYTLKLAWDLSPDFRVAAVEVSRKHSDNFKTYQKTEYLYDGKLKLKPSDFDKLFYILNNETDQIQKANFIQFLFYLGPRISPRKLLEAKTDDFYITDIIKSVNPWEGGEEERQYVYWRPKFKRKKYFEYRIQNEQIELLDKIMAHNETAFPNSPFLFPSKRASKNGHMTSFIDYWNSIKSDTGLPDMPLRKLIGNYMWAHNGRFKAYDPDTISLDDN